MFLPLCLPVSIHGQLIKRTVFEVTCKQYHILYCVELTVKSKLPASRTNGRYYVAKDNTYVQNHCCGCYLEYLFE